MFYNTIRLIIAITFAILVLILISYVKYLERKMELSSKQRSKEHVVGMILCKILVESEMSEQEIQSKVNAELSKISKERR